MRPFSLPPAVRLRCLARVLVFLASVCLTQDAFACSNAVHGISNPGSTVCARDANGTTWCGVANASGNFNIAGYAGPPSTGTGCLPTTGTLFFYNVACPPNGKPVDRDNLQQQYGGSWLDVRCAACVPAPAGMIGWYRFDEASGNVANDHPNVPPPSPATLSGSPAHVPGRVANALQLDGVDDFAQAAGKNVGAGDFSIDLWIRVPPGAGTGQSVILDKRTAAPALVGYHLLLNNGSPMLQLANGTGWTNYPSGLASVADSNWHFLAVTVRRGATNGIQWYLDGTVGTPGNPTLRTGSLSNPAPLRIGRRSAGTPGSPGWFRGALDELEIFNRVLSQTELNAIFQAGAGGKCKGGLPRPVLEVRDRVPLPQP